MEAFCLRLFLRVWSGKTQKLQLQLELHMADNAITRLGIGILGSPFYIYDSVTHGEIYTL